MDGQCSFLRCERERNNRSLGKYKARPTPEESMVLMRNKWHPPRAQNKGAGRKEGGGLLITTDITRDAIFASGKSPSLRPSPSGHLCHNELYPLGLADGWTDGRAARVKYHSAPPPRDSFETARACPVRSVGRSLGSQAQISIHVSR